MDKYKKTILVQDIPQEFELITNSQDVDAVLTHLGFPNRTDYNTLFVLINDGDYDCVYGLYSNVPYNRLEARRIY